MNIKVSKSVAVLIGVLTVWPIVYMFGFLALVASMVLTSTNDDGPRNEFAFFQIVMVLHLGTMVIIMALLVFYIVHVFNNPVLTAANRPLWAVVLFMGGLIAMPIYWYLYVWRTQVPKLENGN